jgi:tetratricopeptide (TPR) repeat protein
LYIPDEVKLLEGKTEVWPPPQSPFRDFHASTFASFRNIVADSAEGIPLPPRPAYLSRVAQLEAKRQQEDLTVRECIELGGCYLRLLKREEAIGVLESARAREPKNALVLANLALANQMLDLYDRAINYEEQALANWPATQEGFSPEQWQWFQRVEKYQLLLMRLRHREALRDTRKTFEDVDALFPNFTFQGNKDDYGPGPAGPGQWGAELPPDAPRIVEQLLIWLPLDNRLYWLLGEVLNAQGKVADAATVLDDLVAKRKYAPPGDLVHKHWRVLREAKSPGGEATTFEQASSSPAADSPAQSGDSNWLPNWRHILVGFVAGIIITVLVQMQWREYTRRRQTKTSVRTSNGDSS